MLSAISLTVRQHNDLIVPCAFYLGPTDKILEKHNISLSALRFFKC